LDYGDYAGVLLSSVMYTVSIPLKHLKEINLLNSKATCSWFTPEHCSFSEKEREGMDKEDEKG